MHMDATTAVGETTIVTLTNDSVTDNDPFTATAGFRFSAGGYVWRNEHNIYSLRNSSTDWIIPHSAASVDYEIRAVQQGTLSLKSGSAALNTWHTLDITRDFIFTCDRFCVEGGSLFVEIRWMSNIIASASYSITTEAT